jgi:hypothetical protein
MGILINGAVIMEMMKIKGNSPAMIIPLAIVAVAIALLPVAALIGTVYGGLAVPSDQEVEEGAATLRAAALQSDLSRKIAQEICEIGLSSCDQQMTFIAPEDPRQGFDTILEVGPEEVMLDGPYILNPPLGLTVIVPVRIFRVADGTIRHELTLMSPVDFQGQLSLWIANEGLFLQSSLGLLRSSLAHCVTPGNLRLFICLKPC